MRDPLPRMTRHNASAMAQSTTVFEQQNAQTVAAQRSRAGERTRVSVVIAAENVAAALEEVRARMAPTCASRERNQTRRSTQRAAILAMSRTCRIIVAAEVVQSRLADRTRVRIERFRLLGDRDL